ncbi:hypothetical protein GIB67_003376 [Kingdonia uniflora]|uniref:GPN-loop GTPase n=1 Tax=Kingdonia uniflora TaxID=39325 RepID=A0A7J7P9M4_9MAGN|nr:hypothetical protein GIB67_003376 [Kingdonia uniflora]
MLSRCLLDDGREHSPNSLIPGKEGLRAKGEKEDLSKSMKSLHVDKSSSGDNFKKKPVIVIVVGMAGMLIYHAQVPYLRGYVVNLNPAVTTLPFGANIDIRDTVRYKEVMKRYNLGPKRRILTSLILVATTFNEVISLIERRVDELDYVFVDTPGQIEIFTWSASGSIITEAFASTFPTVVTYVVGFDQQVQLLL